MLKRFNNIPEIKPHIFIFGVLSILMCSNPIPSEKSFLFCLKSDITPLSINRRNNGFSVDNAQLNRFFDDNIPSVEYASRASPAPTGSMTVSANVSNAKKGLKD